MVTKRDAVILLVVALILGLLTWGPLDLANALQVALMAILVLITGKYAEETRNIAKKTEEQAEASRRMVMEMEKARFDAVRPVLNIRHLKKTQKNHTRSLEEAIEIAIPRKLPDTLWAEVENIGNGPALDIRWFLSSCENPSKPIPSGPTVLAKGEDLNNKIGMPSLPLFFQDTGKPEEKVSIVTYKDIFGNAFESRLLVHLEGQDVKTYIVTMLEINPLLNPREGEKSD